MTGSGRAATTVPARAGSGPVAKTAARTADRIIEDVIALGWPVGTVLGSEADLLERYEVSRAVFREAVRLVEHREVARTRRGPGGGLVVTEPSVEAVIDAVVLYLHRIDARLDEVFETRIVLEEIAAELASRRLGEDDLVILRSFVDESSDAHELGSRALHNALAASSHNPGIELFVDVLNRVAMMYSSGWRPDGLEADIAHAHSRIAAAVIAGDAATARRRMRIHLEAEGEYLRRNRSTRQLLPGTILADHAGTGKRGEEVARLIARSVVDRDLTPGDLIGTEAGLVGQTGVSRAVFREAIRLLEYHQIARMRRGPGGGLLVMEPGPGAVTDVAAIYLARRRMTLGQLSELRTAVELAIVDLAVERMDGAGRGRLRSALEREAEQPERIHDFHTTLAAIASNRVLELVAAVLIRLTTLTLDEKLTARLLADRHRAHVAIGSAVVDGDRALARHRMQRHLAGG